MKRAALYARVSTVDQTTFADLLRAWKEKQEKYVLNWEI